MREVVATTVAFEMFGSPEPYRAFCIVGAPSSLVNADQRVALRARFCGTHGVLDLAGWRKDGFGMIHQVVSGGLIPSFLRALDRTVAIVDDDSPSSYATSLFEWPSSA